jgi:uncharacterized protein YjbI with pentapeptide repeats
VTTIENSAKTVLKDDDAIALWLKGKDTWNAWVKDNPKASVSFYGVNFTTELKNVHTTINFDDFQFPDGDVNFSGASFGDCDIYFIGTSFGDGDVNFSGARFGDGHVNFHSATFGEGVANFIGAKFGDGDVDFTRVTFGEGDVDFTKATFGEGDVDFTRATFGDGHLDFNQAKFGDGDVGFSETKFGDGDVSFYGATFGEGVVNFSGAKFGEGDVDFVGATFGDGHVDFVGATFGDGHVDFSGAKFGEGDVGFSEAKFGDGDVSFHRATFGKDDVHFVEATFGKGHVDFESAFFGGQLSIQRCNKTDSIQSFSFKNCQFKNAVILEDLDLFCVLDLTNTSLQNQISLEGLACKLKRKRGGTWSEIANVSCDKNDIARFRRLKEVCENNKDHELALAFHAGEMRAKRWHKTRYFASWADMAYSGLSDYGNSVSKPLITLVITWFIFAGAYASIAKNFLWESCYQWLQMMGFSIVHSMPFLPTGRSVRKVAFEGYFIDSQSYVFALMTVQSLASLLLIFLVGLGLRNRFRI